MESTSRRLAACFTSLTLALCARAQGHQIFVDLVTGPGDNYALVDPTSYAPTLGSSALLAGANDAKWAHLGADLFVSRTTGASISRAALNGSGVAWSTFASTSGACYGLGLDRAHDRLYTLSGSSYVNRELVALDANPSSPTFGSTIGQTNALMGFARERWGLSRDGQVAAVPPLYLISGALELIDTDPASPTYLQDVASLPVPYLSDQLPMPVAVEFSGDGRWLVLVISSLNSSEVAVLDLTSGAWLDHDPSTPGAQNYALPLSQPTCAELSEDGQSLYVCGLSSGGWAGRLALDPQNPAAWSFAQIAPSLAIGGTAVSLSADGSRFALCGTTPAALLVFDAQSLTLLATVAMPKSVLLVEFDEPCSPPQSYCTSGTTSHGCAAHIAGTGTAVAGASFGFTLTVSQVEGMRLGLIFYGTSGRAAFPWGASTSFLCVKPPTQRTPVQSSGGALNTCTGSLAIDWSAFVAANPGALGAPFAVGARVQAQGWYRDPPSPKTTMLSDALEFEVCP